MGRVQNRIALLLQKRPENRATMSGIASQLRTDAERIWRAGVAAVTPAHLIAKHVQIDGNLLHISDHTIELRNIDRIVIVGAGKAAGAMAVALEGVLGDGQLRQKQVAGWVNVPADCVIPSRAVTLHAARPAGVNEPRPEGVEGTRRILDLADSLRPNDLCLCVLSGGGSALLPAPVPEITLDDKVALTRLLSAAGANIEQLNTVRREVSLIKGGGLARHCRAGRLMTLIISDVLGDPVELIASGPTVLREPEPAKALDVLRELGLIEDASIASIVRYLRKRDRESFATLGTDDGQRIAVAKDSRPRFGHRFGQSTANSQTVSNLIIGNNATAVDAAGLEAERLGYSHAMISAVSSEGPAEVVGHHLAEMALRMRDEQGPNCLISGGEPTVALIDAARRGKGGRNQQLALAALTRLGDCRHLALLSAGTDGEDGPTDAAGAVVDEDVVRRARHQQLDPHDYLSRNDAYSFFELTGSLYITGPTQTNVCDLRIVLADQRARAS